MAGLFDKQAEAYLDARPTYPAEWYSMLADRTSSHSLAWDVGTGNGQAAIGFALGLKRTSLKLDIPPKDYCLRRFACEVLVCGCDPAKEKVLILLSRSVQELENVWGGSKLVRRVVYKGFMLAGKPRS
ncbi:S-adenosyl-L-methionine-dependent methyltransferases superfamily protein [Artemisia annua]|uniref:S-adenosyl-L-methionine-dependent methyltransferases superfamily protein n=1 Tax=Artemisia annua TaxID=35608 RepID=A0A2U1PUS1_ARTAN|nr:S-adenosyl-L-methionine-dependent methyltransferases superfamily protein [Artemisia annua]